MPATRKLRPPAQHVLRSLAACLVAAPLLGASNCSTLGSTIPVKAYADACNHAATSYPLQLTPTSGTGQWQALMGKNIDARLVFSNPASDSTATCTTASGTAQLRGPLPPFLAQIVLLGAQGSWHEEGSNLVVRFGNARKWMTLTLPLDGTQGTWQGGTPADAQNAAGAGEGTVTQRAS